jgi:hypothetical protein
MVPSTMEGNGEVTMVALPDWDEGLKPPQVRFLNSYSLGGSIVSACRTSGVPRSNVYRWKELDELFAGQLQIAQEYGVQRLEDWALNRAMDEMNPSDRLTEFLLKAARPEVYRDRVDHRIHGQVEHRKRVILESLDQTRIVEATETTPEENGDG